MDLSRSIYIIANPASRNGKALKALAWLRSCVAANQHTRVTILETKESKHATKLAAQAIDEGAEYLIALGGDGIIHECVQGLMEVEQERRPIFGVLPAGNGNDFARSIAMPRGNIAYAWSVLLGCEPQSCDVGQVNESYFLQTMSCGLDAAIAQGTHQRRYTTGRSGTLLFVEEGLDQIKNNRKRYRVRLCLDEAEELIEDIHLIAIQNGPSYGSGFMVCPQAQIDDGMFDVCLTRAPLSFPVALQSFFLAKQGLHTNNKNFVFKRASRIEIEFINSEDPVPAQVDGEFLQGAKFDIRCHPGALRVLCPSKAFRGETNGN